MPRSLLAVPIIGLRHPKEFPWCPQTPLVRVRIKPVIDGRVVRDEQVLHLVGSGVRELVGLARGMEHDVTGLHGRRTLRRANTHGTAQENIELPLRSVAVIRAAALAGQEPAEFEIERVPPEIVWRVPFCARRDRQLLARGAEFSLRRVPRLPRQCIEVRPSLGERGDGSSLRRRRRLIGRRAIRRGGLMGGIRLWAAGRDQGRDSTK